MPFPLNKVPRGVLEILRLRTLGKNPQFFDETLQAVVDATSFYGSDLQVVATAQSVAVAISGTVTDVGTVPGRLLAMSGVAVIGAAAGTRLSLQLRFAPNPQSNPVVVAFNTVTPFVGGQLVVTTSFSEPIVFGPGARWEFQTQGDAGGADHNLILRYLFEQYSLS